LSSESLIGLNNTTPKKELISKSLPYFNLITFYPFNNVDGLLRGYITFMHNQKHCIVCDVHDWFQYKCFYLAIHIIS
jgi:hypothetical protein